MEIVLAATLGAIATVLVAVVPVIVVNRRVGKPNGHGNVIEMLTSLYNDLKDLKASHDHLHECFHKQHDAHSQRLGTLEEGQQAIAHDTRNVQQAVMNLQDPGSGDRWRLQRHGREDPKT